MKILLLILTIPLLTGLSAFAETPQTFGEWKGCEILLENPSFEDGFNGWDLEDGACCNRGGLYTVHIDAENPIHGSKCLKVIGHKPTGTAWHAKIRQRNLSMRKDKKYTISFWARAESYRTVAISVQMQHDPWIKYVDGTGNVLLGNEFVNAPRFALSPQWTEYHYTFTAQENVDKDMWVGLSIARHATTFWIDNFRFYEGLPHISKIDVNSDGIVNIKDLVLIASKFGETGERIIHLDVSGNGVVDIFDLTKVANNLGERVCVN